MTILAGDIKLLSSDTMNDLDIGGGAITGDVIVHGQSNNIFDDISTLDRVFGAVHLRKVFGSVFTQTLDKYYGSHVIISKLPGDEKIGVTLFNTDDWFDRRTNAQNRIENYLAQGALYTGFLWATQFEGSKVVTIFQSVTAELPGIGDVLVLKDSINEQFVRIVQLDDSVQTFTDGSGTFDRRILNIEISDPLLNDFVGVEISRFDSLDPDTDVFNTVVANAAKYFGTRPVGSALTTGDSVITVDTIYNQVVPSSQSEASILDEPPANFAELVIQSSSSNTVAFSMRFNTDFATNNNSANMPCAITPESMQITVDISAGDASTSNIFDDGKGVLDTGTHVFNIDYSTGLITLVSGSTLSHAWINFSYLPAANISRLSDTFSLPVTFANRGFVYVANAKPIPTPGSTVVDFMSLGTWYSLKDDGTGSLTASDPSLGQGTINYTTGTISITLGFLPDVDSEIIISFGNKGQYIERSNLATEEFWFKHTLQNFGVQPDTIVITWNDGTARTATSNISGQISGDAVGYIDLVSNEIKIAPLITPLKGTVMTFNYSFGSPLTYSDSGLGGTIGGTHSIALLDTNILPGSVTVIGKTTHEEIKNILTGNKETIETRHVLRDDGVGGFVTLDGSPGVGSINYSTGAIIFPSSADFNFTRPEYEFESRPTGYRDLAGTQQVRDVRHQVGTSVVTVSSEVVLDEIDVTYRTATANAATPETSTIDSIDVDITVGSSEPIVPGSMYATYNGDEYFDRAGFIYRDIDPVTNAGTLSGTINYNTGEVSITEWVGGQTNTGTMKSLLVDVQSRAVYQATIRVKTVPVKIESFTIRAVPESGGGEIQATSDAQGVISATGFEGYIDYETGIVRVDFGTKVLAAGNESESWYDAANVDPEGYIIHPDPVIPSTIVYNAVSITSLPLSAAILGLDPVRLPVDGRVPIYSKGDVVVILNDEVTTATFTNNQVVDLNRVRLAKVVVTDSANNPLAVNQYTVDLDTGILTFGDLTGVSQPISISARIEDMAVVTDRQVTGSISLSQPISHDYPLEGTLVANSVIYGDLFANTSIPFDQQTWTGEWSDTLIGSDVLAQYNNSQFPIIVDNASTLTERWAMIFTSSTTFNIVGENVGVIGTGDTGLDTAPLNPNTGDPYFTIPSGGWGAGWSSGNVLRFNTNGAGAPLWVIQAISQGDETDTDYEFCLELRGDKSNDV